MNIVFLELETLALQPIADEKRSDLKYPSLYLVAEKFGVWDPATYALSRSIILKKFYFELGLPY